MLTWSRVREWAVSGDTGNAPWWVSGWEGAIVRPQETRGVSTQGPVPLWSSRDARLAWGFMPPLQGMRKQLETQAGLCLLCRDRAHWAKERPHAELHQMGGQGARTTGSCGPRSPPVWQRVPRFYKTGFPSHAGISLLRIFLRRCSGMCVNMVLRRIFKMCKE